MAKQTINQGTAPTGAGGDTFRTGSAKLQANDDEIYNYLGDGTNLNKLGTAAFKNTGTQAGNVMEVGAFGLGAEYSPTLNKNDNATASCIITENSAPTGVITTGGIGLKVKNALSYGILNIRWNGVQLVFVDAEYVKSYELLHDQNTTTDSNGFIKKASPIVKVFAEKIELNDEAKQQEITFEKLGVGDYLIKGSTGFAQEGWYVETPKDANGNLLVAVVYEQLENGDISVKTYDYMLNKKGRIVADIEAPLDIPENRWIDIRLQELPQPEFVPPVSNTPASFQPTGISQAVSGMMNGAEQ